MKRLIKSILLDFILYFDAICSYIYWNSKDIRITVDCNISRNARIDKGCTFFNHSIITSDVVVHKNTYGSAVWIQNATIGELCSLGPGIKIGLDEHDISNYSTSPSTYDRDEFMKKTGRVNIGNDVWIGANAVILSGVSIGNGAVVGAGAVVTKDIPELEIWGGVPARKINSRIIKK